MRDLLLKGLAYSLAIVVSAAIIIFAFSAPLFIIAKLLESIGYDWMALVKGTSEIIRVIVFLGYVIAVFAALEYIFGGVLFPEEKDPLDSNIF